MKVLIIENEKDMRELLQTALSVNGCEVTASACCSEAMKELRGEGYDLAIVDLGLPVVDGISCAEKMRFECPDITLFAYTAYDEAVQPANILQRAGFNECFRKGDEPEKLINAVLSLRKE